MTKTRYLNVFFLISLTSAFAIWTPVAYPGGPAVNIHTQHVIDYWTKARIASAIPRDLVIDERGLG
jgi:hypothetical protein